MPDLFPENLEMSVRRINSTTLNSRLTRTRTTRRPDSAAGTAHRDWYA